MSFLYQGGNVHSDDKIVVFLLISNLHFVKSLDLISDQALQKILNCSCSASGFVFLTYGWYKLKISSYSRPDQWFRYTLCPEINFNTKGRNSYQIVQLVKLLTLSKVPMEPHWKRQGFLETPTTQLKTFSSYFQFSILSRGNSFNPNSHKNKIFEAKF